jgi:DNA-binding XRE family transcriptional regulator
MLYNDTNGKYLQKELEMMWILENDLTAVTEKKYLMALLKSRRKEIGLTQTELANITKSSQKQISCYEANIQVPTVGKFLEVCKALELEIIVKRKEQQVLREKKKGEKI